MGVVKALPLLNNAMCPPVRGVGAVGEISLCHVALGLIVDRGASSRMWLIRKPRHPGHAVEMVVLADADHRESASSFEARRVGLLARGGRYAPAFWGTASSFWSCRAVHLSRGYPVFHRRNLSDLKSV